MLKLMPPPHSQSAPPRQQQAQLQHHLLNVSSLTSGTTSDVLNRYSMLLPVSWPCHIPGSGRGDDHPTTSTAGGRSSLSTTHRGESGSEHPRDSPFAHLLVMRGVGSSALRFSASGHSSAAAAADDRAAPATSSTKRPQQRRRQQHDDDDDDEQQVEGRGGSRNAAASSSSSAAFSDLSYVSSLSDYGSVLDDFMERSGCRRAGHATFRMPLPLPSSFPPIFSSQRKLDDVGGWLPGDALSGDDESIDGDHPQFLPHTVPVLVSLQTGPAFGPALWTIREGFRTRDASVLHRFLSSGVGGGDGCNTSVGCYEAHEMEEVDSVLASLADEYSGAQGSH